MSSNGQNRPHELSCPCNACTSLRGVGSLFPTNSAQRPTGGANAPAGGQPAQAQVNQGNATPQTPATMPPNWTPWDNNPALRAAHRQGTRPTHHPYATELELDDPAPSSRQPQANVPNMANARPGTQGGGTQPGYSSGSATNASAIPPTGGALRRPAAYPTSYSNSGAPYNPRAPIPSNDARDYRRNMPHDPRRQQSGAGPSRSQQPSARRRPTTRSSSGEDTPDS